jgi:hypothetical protein
MKILVYLVVAFVYGLLHHAAMRICALALGAAAVDPGVVIAWKRIAFVAVSAFTAAAITTVLWLWYAKSVSLRDGLIAGATAIAFIFAMLLRHRGVDGLLAMLGANPLHNLLTYAIAFAAIPVCVFVAGKLA